MFTRIISIGVLLAAFSLYNNAAFGQSTMPPLDQFDGLRSVRKIKENGKISTYYDYDLMDGSIWTTKSKLAKETGIRDKRPWNERGIKHRLAFYGGQLAVGGMQILTPVAVAAFRK